MLRSRLLYALALFSALLLIRYYEDTALGFTFLYALLLLLAFSLMAVVAAPLFLKIDERADRRELFKNETLHYTASIANRGVFFYPRVRIGYYDHDVIDYGVADAFLAPRGAISADRAIRFPYRGVYRLGIEKVTVTDFLGLFHVTFSVDDPFPVTVCPEADEAFSMSIRADSPDVTHRADPFSESYTDVADIRKYEPSDSLRKIHWKLSAGRGELMVKSYHSFDPSRTLLYIDTRATPLEGEARAAYEDRMICFAAAAVNHCMEHRLPALLAHGDRLSGEPEIKADGDPLALYRLLAGIAFDRPGSAFPAFCEAMGLRIAAFNLVLFLPAVDEAVFDALRALHSHEHSIAIHCFSLPGAPPDPAEEERLQSLAAIGVAVGRVAAVSDIPA